MRVLVISDIHSNLQALEAVLADAGAVDETWCLGDVVGYGPQPNEVIARIREIAHFSSILGNHDVAVLGQMDDAVFNTEARKSLLWQKQQIVPENLAYLQGLPGELQVRGEVSMAHGSPRDPVWEYILNTLTARLNFGAFSTPYCFIGHSHLQGMFVLDMEKDLVSQYLSIPGNVVTLKPRMILNPGSVGQPRDRDPRAAYAIYDRVHGTWEPRRVEYDVPLVQKLIRGYGLPEKHAARLTEGW